MANTERRSTQTGTEAIRAVNKHARSFAVLINPISGTGNKALLRERLSSAFSKANATCHFFDTDPAGLYVAVAKKIKELQLNTVVICGGDGTVSTAVNALRHLTVDFGIVPMGSGNGLAYGAKIPAAQAKAIQLLLTGKALSIDAFTVNEKFAVMLAGLGFDAQVAHEFQDQKKRGLLTYIRISSRVFFTCKALPFEIIIGEKQLPVSAYFISFANSNQFGNQFTIAPRASLSDGLLDIIIAGKSVRLNLALAVLTHLRFGKVNETIISGKTMNYLQAPEFTVINKEMAPLHIDGERAETAERIQVKIIPGAYKLISG